MGWVLLCNGIAQILLHCTRGKPPPDAHKGRHYISTCPTPPTQCMPWRGDGAGGWARPNVVTPLVGVRRGGVRRSSTNTSLEYRDVDLWASGAGGRHL